MHTFPTLLDIVTQGNHILEENENTIQLLQKDVQRLEHRVQSIEASIQNRRPLDQTIQGLSNTVQQLIGQLEELKSPEAGTEFAGSLRHVQEIINRDADASPMLANPVKDSEAPAFTFDLISPIDWHDVMEKAYAASGRLPIDVSSPLDPRHYVQRLINLHVAYETLSTCLAPCLWTPYIAHLDIKESQGFVVHRMLSSPQADGMVLSCQGCATTWTEQRVFYAFLCIESSQHPIMWVFLPLGSFIRDNFPRGYNLLLAQVPGGRQDVTAVLVHCHVETIG
jgi:uncharacterized protein YoxC